LVQDFAVHLFGLAVAEVELLDTELQRVEERRADLLAKIAEPNGAISILHIEIQNANAALIPARMLRYLSDVILEYPGIPTRQYLVYIGREPLAMADGLDMPRFSYRYDIIDMHTINYRDLLESDSPDAWVLAILCDFQGRLPRDIVHNILAQLSKKFAENLPRLRDYVDMLDILASNRSLNLDIREELKMLTIEVEKLATYQLGMEKGMEQGMEQGVQTSSRAIAINLLRLGMAPDTVASVTGLASAEVGDLAAKERNPT